MSNLDALLAPATTTNGKLCNVGRAVADLPDSYRIPFQQQLDLRWKDGGATDLDLARRMQTAGFKVSPATVNRHRAGTCTCPQEGN